MVRLLIDENEALAKKLDAAKAETHTQALANETLKQEIAEAKAETHTQALANETLKQEIHTQAQAFKKEIHTLGSQLRKQRTEGKCEGGKG